MATALKYTFEEFRKLQEAPDDANRYELDEGDLIVTPSPNPRHNIISFRLRSALAAFVSKFDLGFVIGEVDFRLSANLVRKPDVAFLAASRFASVDPRRAPIDVAPTLAIEVISPGNLAHDIAKKIRQYLDAGSEAVWIVYPDLHLIEVHSHSGIRQIASPKALAETELFGSHIFTMPLVDLFEEDLKR